ncbi:unnamed protein product [Timema podura]|uniref:TACO1/YebC-like second and third domain-containing protein n=1 Tax=Timema podura TaxID=61482 RepID=A0ABN7NX98_TIMPD|nr:unnamed protein product [Timema podura]
MLDIRRVLGEGQLQGILKVFISHVGTLLRASFIVKLSMPKFVCAAEQFHHVKKKLMELHYQIHSAGQMYIARNYVTLSDTDLQAVTKLCEKLEEHVDVMCLYDNIL